ncbi:unnamed protein product, partial [Meganyctiphanes norvegica]
GSYISYSRISSMYIWLYQLIVTLVVGLTGQQVVGHARDDILVRQGRGPGDGCGPNPLARLAHALTLLTGERVDVENVAWRLQQDPYLWQEMAAVLHLRQYHNCITTGDGARF